MNQWTKSVEIQAEYSGTSSNRLMSEGAFVADLVRTSLLCSDIIPRSHSLQAAVLYARCQTISDAFLHFDNQEINEPDQAAYSSLQISYCELIESITSMGGDIIRLDQAIIAVFLLSEKQQATSVIMKAVIASCNLKSQCKRLRIHIQIGIGFGVVQSLHIGGAYNQIHHVIMGDALTQAAAACAAIGSNQTAIMTTSPVKSLTGRLLTIWPAKSNLYKIISKNSSMRSSPSISRPQPYVDVRAYLQPLHRLAIPSVIVDQAIIAIVAISRPNNFQQFHEITIAIQSDLYRYRGQIVTINTETDDILFTIGFGLPPDLDISGASSNAASFINNLASLLIGKQIRFSIGAEHGIVHCNQVASRSRAFIIVHGPACLAASRQMAAGRAAPPHVRLGPRLQSRVRDRDETMVYESGIYAGFGSDARQWIRNIPFILSTQRSIYIVQADHDRPFSIWIDLIQDLARSRQQNMADTVRDLCPQHDAALLNKLMDGDSMPYESVSALIIDLVEALITSSNDQLMIVIDADPGLDVTSINIFQQLITHRHLSLSVIIACQQPDPLLISSIPGLCILHDQYDHSQYIQDLMDGRISDPSIIDMAVKCRHGYALGRIYHTLYNSDIKQQLNDVPDAYLCLARRIISQLTDGDRMVLALIAALSSRCQFHDLVHHIADKSRLWHRLKTLFDAGLIMQTATNCFGVVGAHIQTMLQSSWTQTELTQIRREHARNRTNSMNSCLMKYVKSDGWISLSSKAVVKIPLPGWRYGITDSRSQHTTSPPITFVTNKTSSSSSINNLILRLIMQQKRRSKAAAAAKAAQKTGRTSKAGLRRIRSQPGILTAEHITPCNACHERLSNELQAHVNDGINVKVFHSACQHHTHHRLVNNHNYMPRSPSLLPADKSIHIRPKSALTTVARQMARHYQGGSHQKSARIHAPVTIEVRLLDAVTYHGWRIQRSRSSQNLILCGTQSI